MLAALCDAIKTKNNLFKTLIPQRTWADENSAALCESDSRIENGAWITHRHICRNWLSSFFLSNPKFGVSRMNSRGFLPPDTRKNRLFFLQKAAAQKQRAGNFRPAASKKRRQSI